MPATPKPAYDRLAARRRLAEKYHEDNLLAARIYLSDPLRYPGIMQDWARAVIAAEEHEQREWRLTA